MTAASPTQPYFVGYFGMQFLFPVKRSIPTASARLFAQLRETGA